MAGIRFGKKKDPLKDAEEEEVRAREALEAAARRRAELAERTEKTPVIDAANVAEAVAKIEQPVVPAVPKLSKEQEAALAQLREVVAALEAYGGAFPELGPSGHADVERTLLLACFGELRALRAALEK